jgi:hypothetical protein
MIGNGLLLLLLVYIDFSFNYCLLSGHLNDVAFLASDFDFDFKKYGHLLVPPT